MGWSSGSRIASELIESIYEVVDDYSIREAIYVKMIDVFGDNDCDTLDECLGVDPAFDKMYKEAFSDFNDDWDESDE